MASIRNTRLIRFSLICFFLLIALIASAEQSYPDSAQGLQAELIDIIHAAGADQMAARTALDSLVIPNSDKWFAAHFDPRFTQLPADYVAALAKFQSHVAWVGANFSKFDDFGLTAQALDKPSPLRDVGFESLLPKPLDDVKIENYRLTSTSSDPKHGPPSWVSGFVYVEGRFRWVGGTYPFWDEGLTALRGPMSMAPTIIHGRTVQGIAYRKDQKGPGLDGIVQLKINIGRDGRVDHVKVLSGDEQFVQAAKEYVKRANFGPLPSIPQLANAKREWELEVAFFTPKQ
jgi:hypothetical protein